MDASRPLATVAAQAQRPSVYSVLVASADAEIRAAQRLRHLVFAQELGARLHSCVPGLDVDGFDLTALDPLRGVLVEAGRSCVHPDHRGGAGRCRGMAWPVRAARVGGVVAAVAVGVPLALAMPARLTTAAEPASAPAEPARPVQGSTHRQAPGRITHVRPRIGPETSPSALA